MPAPSMRARVRAEMIEEIKVAARRRLVVDGSNLSLRGVARDMGIVASALYRYFPSRDDLLTVLIMDAYQGLSEAAKAAEAQAPPEDARGRWHAVCTGVREWALAHTVEYELLYGSPVPGYAAPPDTVAPASAIVMLLVDITADAAAAGPVTPLMSTPIPALVRADLRRLIEQRQQGEMPEELLDRVFVAWTHLFGLVNFEIFGRLAGTIEARREYFDHHMSLMADLTGLP